MGRRSLQALGALAAVGAAGYSSVAMPVLAPSLEGELGLTTGALGLLLSLGMAGSCVGGLAAGWLADRLGALRSLRGSMATCAAGCLLSALGGRLPALLWPGLVVVGLGAGGAYVAAGGLLAGLFPERRRGSFSGLMVTNAVAGIGFPVLVASLDGLWRRGALDFAWVLAGPYAAVALVLLLLTALLRGETARPEAFDAPPVERRAATGTGAGAVVMLVALATIHGTSDGVLYTWMPRFLTERFPEAPFPPGWVLSFYAAAYLIGRLTLTFLPDRFGRRALVTLPGLLSGPLLMLALHAPSMGLVAAGYAAASLLYGLEFPALMGLASQRYPERFSMIFGWVSGTTAVVTLGVWGVGRWAEATGRMAPALTVAASGFLLFGLLATAWLLWEARRAGRAGCRPD